MNQEEHVMTCNRVLRSTRGNVERAAESAGEMAVFSVSLGLRIEAGELARVAATLGRLAISEESR